MCLQRMLGENSSLKRQKDMIYPIHSFVPLNQMATTKANQEMAPAKHAGGIIAFKL